MLVGTPASRPAALLDFASGSIDPRLTFSRASTATRVSRAGSIETVAAGLPRIDHDPLTGAVRGVLIEPQSTNLLRYSSVLSGSSWAKARVSVEISSAIYTPMGAQSYKLVEDSAPGGHYMYQSATLVVGELYTLSVYAKSGERDTFILKHYYPSGSPSSNALFSTVDGSIVYASRCIAKAEAITNGWYRFSITFTALSATSTAWISLGSADYSGDGVSGMYFCGAQLEMSSSASSPIETTSSQVTRAADSLSLQSAAFSRVIAASKGTLYIELMHNRAAWPETPPAALCLSDGSGTGETSGIVVSLSASGTALDVTSSGVSQASLSSSSGSAAGIHRVAIAYKNDRFALSTDGLAAVSDLSGTAPAISRLDVGSAIGARHFSGWIRRIAVFPRDFDNVILQNMSI